MAIDAPAREISPSKVPDSANTANKELEKIISALNDFLFIYEPVNAQHDATFIDDDLLFIDESKNEYIKFFVQHEDIFTKNAENTENLFVHSNLGSDEKKEYQKRFDDAFSLFKNLKDSGQYKKALEDKKRKEADQFKNALQNKKLSDTNSLPTTKEEKEARIKLIECLNELVAVEKKFDTQIEFFVEHEHEIKESFIKNLKSHIHSKEAIEKIRQQLNEIFSNFKKLREICISDYLMIVDIGETSEEKQKKDLEYSLARIKFFFSHDNFQRRLKVMQVLTKMQVLTSTDETAKSLFAKLPDNNKSQSFASLIDNNKSKNDPDVKELLTLYVNTMSKKTKDELGKHAFSNLGEANRGLGFVLTDLFDAPNQKMNRYPLIQKEMILLLEKYDKARVPSTAIKDASPDPKFNLDIVGFANNMKSIVNDIKEKMKSFDGSEKITRDTSKDTPATLLTQLIKLNHACTPRKIRLSFSEKDFGLFEKRNPGLHETNIKWKRQLKQLEKEATAIFLKEGLDDTQKLDQIRNKITQRLGDMQNNVMYKLFYKDSLLENELLYLAGNPLDAKAKKLNTFIPNLDQDLATTTIQRNIVDEVKKIFQTQLDIERKRSKKPGPLTKTIENILLSIDKVYLDVGNLNFDTPKDLAIALNEEIRCNIEIASFRNQNLMSETFAHQYRTAIKYLDDIQGISQKDSTQVKMTSYPTKRKLEKQIFETEDRSMSLI